MAAQTKIGWCDSTFNGWRICTPAGPGCDNCYAAAMAKAFGWGEYKQGVPRHRHGEEKWEEPHTWNRLPFYECSNCKWRGDYKAACKAEFVKDTPIACGSCATGVLLPARRRVFCLSLGDWLDNEVPTEWLLDLLSMIQLTQNLDWLLLTKRIGNWRKRLQQVLELCELRISMSGGATFETAKAMYAWVSAWLNGNAPDHIWLLATVCNQEEAERDVVKLLRVPARIHGLSIEPMLGAVNLRELHIGGGPTDGLKLDALTGLYSGPASIAPLPHRFTKGIDWIIPGGESGRGEAVRPAHPDWFRSLRDQCSILGALFFKQWGAWKPVSQMDETEMDKLYHPAPITRPDATRRCKHRTTVLTPDGETGERYLPGAMLMFQIGAEAAGNTLDGRQHMEFPV